MSMAHYDVLIVGGGLVGMSLACALAHSGMRIGVVEALAPQTQLTEDFDARSIALSLGSQQLLQTFGLWPELMDKARQLNRVHVSQSGYWGATTITAEAMGVPALGYVVQMPHLLAALMTVRSVEAVDVLGPAVVEDVAFEASRVVVSATGLQCSAKLLIAADGQHSKIRQDLQIPLQQKSYGQHALVTNLGVSQDGGDTAFERFDPKGPLALLPLPGRRLALVWTGAVADIQDLQALPDLEFIARCHDALGYPRGRFTQVGRRMTFPLFRTFAQEQIRPRCVLLGNAAHNLHPVAAQGFNLSLRDVAALSDVLGAAHRAGADLGATRTLAPYMAARAPDQCSVASFTDALIHGFSQQVQPLNLANAGALLAFDRIKGLQSELGRRAMGLV